MNIKGQRHTKVRRYECTQRMRSADFGLDSFASRLTINPVGVGRYPLQYRSQDTFIVTELTGANLAQLPDGVRLPGGDHVIVRRGLLEHPPHGLHVIPGVAPVPAGLHDPLQG